MMPMPGSVIRSLLVLFAALLFSSAYAANTYQSDKGAVARDATWPAASNVFTMWKGAVQPSTALSGIQRTGTFTVDHSTAVTLTHNYTHTTTADTDLLLVFVHVEGIEAVSGTPTYNAASMTLIQDQGAAVDNNDTREYVYGIVSPGAVVDGTVDVDFASNVNPSTSWAINYHGTDTASVAAATNQAGSDQNTTASSTVVMSSAGTSGNALVISVFGQGNDMIPISFDNSFVELWDAETGGGSATADFGGAAAEKLSAPSAVTATFSATDENSGLMVELVMPSAGADVLPFLPAIFIGTGN
jgi:hypothetical protein